MEHKVVFSDESAIADGYIPWLMPCIPWPMGEGSLKIGLSDLWQALVWSQFAARHPV